MSTENIGVSMIRATLDDLPTFVLPAPYSLRWYQPGDEKSWVEIHIAADHYITYTPELFEREFGAGRALLPTRQAYLCDGTGTAVGTTSAWFYTNKESNEESGMVHWVAIHPAHQGQGLAKPLLALICQRLRELGHDRGYLATSTGRIPAINLYLKFGFVPQMGSDREKTLYAWRQVRERLTHPALDEFLKYNG